jgi:SRSO17 transposase
MVAEFAFLRGVAVRDKLPGPDVWIVFRRSLGEERELKVYLSNAPAETPVGDLVRVVGLRWPIETAIQEGKDGLGMDHYEVRTWLGWHHHMTECLLAHHFLVRCQQRLKGALPHSPSGKRVC